MQLFSFSIPFDTHKINGLFNDAMLMSVSFTLLFLCEGFIKVFFYWRKSREREKNNVGL